MGHILGKPTIRARQMTLDASLCRNVERAEIITFVPEEVGRPYKGLGLIAELRAQFCIFSDVPSDLSLDCLPVAIHSVLTNAA